MSLGPPVVLHSLLVIVVLLHGLLSLTVLLQSLLLLSRRISLGHPTATLQGNRLYRRRQPTAIQCAWNVAGQLLLGPGTSGGLLYSYPECLVEYCSAIYCPHAAMENGLQYRMWAQLSTAWKLITNVSAMPMKVLLLIVRSVGAHNQDTCLLYTSPSPRD